MASMRLARHVQSNQVRKYDHLLSEAMLDQAIASDRLDPSGAELVWGSTERKGGLSIYLPLWLHGHVPLLLDGGGVVEAGAGVDHAEVGAVRHSRLGRAAVSTVVARSIETPAAASVSGVRPT